MDVLDEKMKGARNAVDSKFGFDIQIAHRPNHYHPAVNSVNHLNWWARLQRFLCQSRRTKTFDYKRRYSRLVAKGKTQESYFDSSVCSTDSGVSSDIDRMSTVKMTKLACSTGPSLTR